MPRLEDANGRGELIINGGQPLGRMNHAIQIDHVTNDSFNQTQDSISETVCLELLAESVYNENITINTIHELIADSEELKRVCSNLSTKDEPHRSVTEETKLIIFGFASKSITKVDGLLQGDLFTAFESFASRTVNYQNNLVVNTVSLLYTNKDMINQMTSLEVSNESQNNSVKRAPNARVIFDMIESIISNFKGIKNNLISLRLQAESQAVDNTGDEKNEDISDSMPPPPFEESLDFAISPCSSSASVVLKSSLDKELQAVRQLKSKAIEGRVNAISAFVLRRRALSKSNQLTLVKMKN